jgi:hypothetical protein
MSMTSSQQVDFLTAHALSCAVDDRMRSAWRVGAETGQPVPIVHFRAVVSRATLMRARQHGLLELTVVNHRAAVTTAAVITYLLTSTSTHDTAAAA